MTCWCPVSSACGRTAAIAVLIRGFEFAAITLGFVVLVSSIISGTMRSDKLSGGYGRQGLSGSSQSVVACVALAGVLIAGITWKTPRCQEGGSRGLFFIAAQLPGGHNWNEIAQALVTSPDWAGLRFHPESTIVEGSRLYNPKRLAAGRPVQTATAQPSRTRKARRM